GINVDLATEDYGSFTRRHRAGQEQRYRPGIGKAAQGLGCRRRWGALSTVLTRIPGRLVCQGIRAQLEVDDARLTALATFHQPRRPIAARRPQSSTLPAGTGIVDAPIKAFGVKAQRIRHPQHDHAAILEGDQTIIEISRRHWHVLAEAKGVVLIHPRIVARLRTVLANAQEARARILVERPPLLTMPTRCGWPVQRTLALAPVKATDMAASQRHPNDALFVDVTAARSEAGCRNVVDFGQRRRGRVGPRV